MENNQAQPGDVIILTKPLGTQIVTDLYSQFSKDKDLEAQVLGQLNLNNFQFESLYQKCINGMTTLNLYAAQTMQKYLKQIKACTDVTGFGLVGHSDNLVQIQQEGVDFLIE